MRLAILACLTLPACLPAAPDAPAADLCEAGTLQHLVGATPDSFDFNSLGHPLRLLPHGAMMTMDYRPDRLNVSLDAQGVIDRIWCG